MLNANRKVLSWILIVCMIFSTKAMFVFADTVSMSYNEHEKNDKYIEDEIEECSSESDAIEFFDNEDDNYIDVTYSEEPEEDIDILSEINNDETFESIEIKNDIIESDIVEANDVESEFDFADTNVLEKTEISANKVYNDSLENIIANEIDSDEYIATSSDLDDEIIEYELLDLENDATQNFDSEINNINLFGASNDIVYKVKYNKNLSDDWHVYNGVSETSWDVVFSDNESIASESDLILNNPINLKGSTSYKIYEEIVNDEFTANRTLRGWSTSASGEVEYNPGTSISDVSLFDASHELNLYAIWSDRVESKVFEWHYMEYAGTIDYDHTPTEHRVFKVYKDSPGGRDYYWDALEQNHEPSNRVNNYQVCGMVKLGISDIYNHTAVPNMHSFDGSIRIFSTTDTLRAYLVNEFWNNSSAESFKIGLCYKNIDNVEILNPPTNVNYNLGATFDSVDGLKIRYNYTNAASEEITLSDATIGDFTFNPARGSSLPNTPQTINVQVTHKGNLVNDTFAIYVGNAIIKLKLTPSNGGTFGAGLNDSISFTTVTDFDSYKNNVNITGIGGYEYINEWSDGTTSNINVTSYVWDGTNNVTLTTNLSPQLRFIIKDSDAANAHFNAGDKTTFNRDEGSLFVSAPIVVCQNGYHFEGWVKNGTSTIVSGDTITYVNSFDSNAPVTYLAKISNIITYRVTFENNLDSSYHLIDAWPNDITITTSSTAFNPGIKLPNFKYLTNDYSRRLEVSNWLLNVAVYPYSYTRAPGFNITDSSWFNGSHIVNARIQNTNLVYEPKFTVYKKNGSSGVHIDLYRYDPNALTTLTNFLNITDDDFIGFYQFGTSEGYDYNKNTDSRLTADQVIEAFNAWKNLANPTDIRYGAIYLYYDSIRMIGKPVKTNFLVGDIIDLTGIKVEVHYDNYPTQTVSYDSSDPKWTFDPPLSTMESTAGTYNPGCYYMGHMYAWNTTSANNNIQIRVLTNAPRIAIGIEPLAGGTYDRIGSTYYVQSQADYIEQLRFLRQYRTVVNSGWRNIDDWSIATTTGTTYTSTPENFIWDGVSDVDVINHLSPLLTIEIDETKGTVSNTNRVFHRKQRDLFEAASFEVNEHEGWNFIGWEKTIDGTVLSDLTWNNAFSELGPIKLIASFSAIPRTVQNISIKTNPQKTNYVVNDNFIPNGLSINLHYNYGPVDEIVYNVSTQTDFTFSPNTTTPLNIGDNSVRITYKNDKYVDLPINVVPRALESINIYINPNKIHYIVNEHFNPAGLVLKLNFNNSDIEYVTYNEITKNYFSFNPATSSVLNTSNNHVSVTYESLTTTINITVSDNSTPIPTPPSGGGGGNSSGGGSGGVTNGPFTNTTPKILNINYTKNIKDVINGNTCVWNYELNIDKWSLSGIGLVGNKVSASDGFYIIYRSSNRIINGVVLNDISNSTYFFDSDGKMWNGFIKTVDGKYYFFDNSKTIIEGQMALGWKQILNDWYYFTSDGSMLVSAFTPDGYLVGADGKYLK